MAEIRNITELPLDILDIILPYLDAKSFLAFCSTCRAFQQPSIRLDPAYWSFQTRSTFRVPNQPTVQYDGDRWRKLYRRLFTQTRVYTWGSEGNHRLGHHTSARSCSYPQEMSGAQKLGVIVDLQCGGWSTTILNSEGSLYSVGLLDGERYFGGESNIKQLAFPPEFIHGDKAAITIRQFSAGRSHILGLSDSGRIWTWNDMKRPATQIKFANIDLKDCSSGGAEPSNGSAYGTVKQVIAGWSYSSAYIHGIGIIIWNPVRPRPVVQRPHARRLHMMPVANQEPESSPDTMLVLENFELPKTKYQRPKGVARESTLDRTLGEEVGQVENYILLEHFVVYATDIGKVFCSKFEEKDKSDNILELCMFRSQTGETLDVQGSFRRFAVFRDGEVIIAEQSYLEACWNARSNNPGQIDIAGLKLIPALQHNNIVSIAFGDFHFLALHSTGKIKSYGLEIQRCGALGLGDQLIRFRGAVPAQGMNFTLHPHCYMLGREVWFRDEQKDWLSHLLESCRNDEEAAQRFDMFLADNDVAAEVSEWIEQEGKAWDQDSGEDGLGAYFALRVSAAGWHSGAVLLVNEELANKASTFDWRSKSFPRLELSSGEMPGSAPLDTWREGRPDWQPGSDHF